MDNKSIWIAGLVVGVVAILGGLVWSGDKLKGHKGDDHKEVVAMAMAAKITIDQATALENFQGE